MSNTCIFTNDGNIEIKVINHKYTDAFIARNNHEVLFRKIHTFLIDCGYIRNNIIDSGCWIGDNSIPWALRINGVVYSIDPSEDNGSFINEMCSMNDIYNIKFIQKALSDSKKILSTNNDLHHCLLSSGIDGCHKLETTTLDLLMEDGVIENIGYIHLDVETYEKEVILGSSQLIHKYRPLITFEQHLTTDDHIGLCEHLKSKKYAVYMINESPPGCREDCRNFLAVPIEKHSVNFVKDINSFIGTEGNLILI